MSDANIPVILSARRTPIGGFLGALKSRSAPQLGAIAARAALRDAKLSGDAVDEVLVGNVLPAGEGQAPARQVALGADLPNSVPCTTLNKVCGSGLKAVMLAAQAVKAGDAQVVLAGGMESMSNVPFYVQGARDGLKFGDQKLVDGMVKDGLWDVYNDYHMGVAAELCAREQNISRAAQDAFATESYARAVKAQADGAFAAEIVPVEIPGRRGEVTVVDTDEEPGRGRPDKFAGLRPAFQKDGTVTAANASSLNDGAAMVVVSSLAWAKAHQVTPMATIHGYASAAQAPEWFTTAPAKAMQSALDRVGWSVGDVDLFEVNEAFSVVSLANEALLSLDATKVNVYGGAVSLGHPIGASGTRILVTLLHALRRENKQRGMASLCIGGGEAVAMAVERNG